MSPSPILAAPRSHSTEAALTACPPFVGRAPGLVTQDFSTQIAKVECRLDETKKAPPAKCQRGRVDVACGKVQNVLKALDAERSV